MWGAALEATVKVGPARRLTGVRVALALVANPVPLRRLHNVREEGGGVGLEQVAAEEEEVESVLVQRYSFAAWGGGRALGWGVGT